MPPKKDWRNFEQRRELALNQRQSPYFHQQHPYYQNQAYDYHNDRFYPHAPSPYNSSYQDGRSYYHDDPRFQNFENQINPSPSGYSPEPELYDDNPIQKKRKCRDIVCLGFLFVSIVVMIGAIGYAVVQGDFQRFSNGVDLDCDICGIANSPLPGILNSGKDLRQLHLLVMNKSQKRSNDIRFPTDISQFDTFTGLSPGLRQCRNKCPPENKIILNRCMAKPHPENATSRVGNIARIQTDATLVEEDVINFWEEVAEDLENNWEAVLWICLISLGVAVAVTFLLRIFTGIIIWGLVFVISIGAIGGTIALWVVWYTQNDHGTDEAQGTYMAGAIVASIFTVILLLTFLFMRKRIKLVIQLFKEAGKAVQAMPLLLFQPLVTFLALGIALCCWLVVAILIETSGKATESIESGTIECTFRKDSFSIFSRWWNLFMITWITVFIVGCEQLIVAGAVSIWFFTRDKRNLGYPIALSYKRLVRYHMGSIALGSLIIAIVKIIRYILHTLQKRLGRFSKFFSLVCVCCIWCLEKFLIFLNRNAYIEIAIYGYGFCKSARKGFSVIVNNILRVAAINSIGDFVLFLAKVGIVAVSVLIGNEFMKSKVRVNHSWVLLIIGGVFAYLIAHCFICVYEMAIDTIFLCFCEDCEMNDGVQRPYFMSKGLMEYVKNSKKFQKAKKKDDEKSN